MTENLQTAIVSIIPFLLAVSLHEAAHAFVADRLGDHTSRMMGRLSLNPIVHADPFGTILFPLLAFFTSLPIFGWAKPVPVIERNLRWKKYGMLAVAAAGPAMNLIMALFFSIAFIFFIKHVNPGFYFFEPFRRMLEAGVFINVILAFFNLIPLPPLDGSRILEPFLPYNIKRSFMALESYSAFILMGMIILGVTGKILFPVIMGTRVFLEYLYGVIA